MEMTKFPEIIRKGEPVTEKFLFWLRTIGEGGKEVEKLMQADESGYAEASTEAKLQEGKKPVYMPLFGFVSLINIGEFA